MLLTVIMPVYNSQVYIEEAIKSILNQSFKDFYLYVLNDNSTDNSLSILQDFAQKDSRVKIFNFEENKGPAILRNFALSKVNTEYIAFMDSDDISLPNRFEKQVQVLNKNKSIKVCGSWFDMFGDNIETETIKHFEFHKELKINFLNGCYIGCPTIMAKSEIFNEYLFDKNFLPIEDYELWTRLISKYEFYNIQETLLLYRWHDKNISHSNKANIKNLHNKIRVNQLLLNFESELPENHFYLLALQYEEGKIESLPALKLLFKAGDTLIKLNRKYDAFDKDILRNFISKSRNKYISLRELWSFKFMCYLYFQEFKTIVKLTIKEQFYMTKKSIKASLKKL